MPCPYCKPPSFSSEPPAPLMSAAVSISLSSHSFLFPLPFAQQHIEMSAMMR